MAICDSDDDFASHQKKLTHQINKEYACVPPAKAKVHDSFVDFSDKSYEYSYSDGEVDNPQAFPSDEVRSEPEQDSCGSILLEPCASSIEGKSQCVPALRFF